MKKLISLALAIAMLMCGTVSAFANDYQAYTEAAFLQQSAERLSEEMGMPVRVVDYQTEETDDFEIYTMLVEPEAASRSGNTTCGTTVHSWKDKKTGTFLGEVCATAYFEYNSSSAIVTDHFPLSDLDSDCSYIITSESWKNSSAFNKAYYKFTYTFHHDGRSAKTTIEVNCSNDGVIGNEVTVKKV